MLYIHFRDDKFVYVLICCFTANIFFKYQAALMSQYSQLGCTEELQLPNVLAKFTAAIFGANEYRDYSGVLT
jgi:hypothetical protein